jgi:hypothetical protein
MQSFRLRQRVDRDGHLRIDMAPFPQGAELEVLVVVEAQESPQGRDGPGIDDLVGRLSWKGDPVATQRALRDEW